MGYLSHRSRTWTRAWSNHAPLRDVTGPDMGHLPQRAAWEPVVFTTLSYAHRLEMRCGIDAALRHRAKEKDHAECTSRPGSPQVCGAGAPLDVRRRGKTPLRRGGWH